jgi:hypothetical protein
LSLGTEPNVDFYTLVVCGHRGDRGGGEPRGSPASIYLGNLAASWQTWVLEHTGTGWEVTGTTGPVAIS